MKKEELLFGEQNKELEEDTNAQESIFHEKKHLFIANFSISKRILTNYLCNKIKKDAKIINTLTNTIYKKN